MMNNFTEKEYWDKYWKNHKGPFEIKRRENELLLNEILDIFDRYLPVNENMNVLEIGGAPGHYLMYMAKNYKYKVHSLDYSKVGNELTIKNFQIAGLDVKVYEMDFFSDACNVALPKFDIVYSLGFIEHFEDLKEVIRRHTMLLKTDGILLLGVPNLRGIYRIFLRQTAPIHLSLHNLDSMDLKNWNTFEKELHLKSIFKGYVGGFEPKVMKKLEKKNPMSYLLNFIVKVQKLIFSCNLRFLRKLNSPYWSGYLVAIYKKSV